MKKENLEIPGYKPDKTGTFVRHDEHGKWRTLDIEDGHLVALNTKVLMDRAMNRARVSDSTVKIPAKYR